MGGLMKKIGAFILKGVKAIVKLFPKGLVRIVQTNIEGLVKSFLKVVAPGALDQAKLNKAMMKVVRWKSPRRLWTTSWPSMRSKTTTCKQLQVARGGCPSSEVSMRALQGNLASCL